MAKIDRILNKARQSVAPPGPGAVAAAQRAALVAAPRPGGLPAAARPWTNVATLPGAQSAAVHQMGGMIFNEFGRIKLSEISVRSTSLNESRESLGATVREVTRNNPLLDERTYFMPGPNGQQVEIKAALFGQNEERFMVVQDFAGLYLYRFQSPVHLTFRQDVQQLAAPMRRLPPAPRM